MARFGEIGKQYFDDGGDPLVSGKLFFFESGTNTDKDTFADVNLSIKNSNPVILTGAGRQPNIFFNGTARVQLTKNDDTQIEVRDPEGGTFEEGVFSPWNALTIYNIPDIVVGSDGMFYISIVNANQGNDPTTPSLASWSQIRFIRVFNANETYTAGQITEGSDGLLYSSITSSNQGNDPVNDTVNWKPATKAGVSAVIEASAAIFAFNNF